MIGLQWGIKASLIAYVTAMSDGRVELDGARSTPRGFVFPAADDAGDGFLRFRGSVTLSGHDGMMHVRFGEPWLVPLTAGGWMLSLADDGGGPGGRLDFARLARFDADDDGLARGRGTALTADGADLFFGPYTEGTPLDDPELVEL